MPKDKKPADQERTPEEAAALARSVMDRMLHSPPVPHEKLNGKSKRAKTKKLKR